MTSYTPLAVVSRVDATERLFVRLKMAAVMDDDELRRKLKEFGEDVVITDSTRNLLTKRFRRLSESRQPGNTSSSNRRSLLNFSSDESESDGNSSRSASSGFGAAILGSVGLAQHNNGAGAGSGSSSGRKTRRTSNLSNADRSSPAWNDTNFRKPKKPSRRSMFSADSRLPEQPPPSPVYDKSPSYDPFERKRRNLSDISRSSEVTSSTTRRSELRRMKKDVVCDSPSSESDGSDNSIILIPENKGVNEFPASRRSILTSLPTNIPSSASSSLSNGGGSYNSHSSSSSFRDVSSIGRNSFLSPSGAHHREDNIINNSTFSMDSSSPINDHSSFLEESNTEISASLDISSKFSSAVTAESSKNHSQCISMILVIIFAIFFLILGVIYFRYSHQVPYDALDNTCTQSGGMQCTEKLDSLSVTEVAMKLKDDLRALAGEVECNELLTSSKMSIREADNIITSLRGDKQYGLKDVLDVFQKNKLWGIRFFDFDHTETVESDPNLMYLESSVAELPWLCKLKRAWKNTVYKVSIGLVVALVLLAIFAAGYFYKERQRKFQQEMYTLIENILESLQTNYNSDNVLDPYMPIPHVRDRLLPPAERVEKRGVWEAAVKYIAENESRVRQEVRMIKGEDISVWHWLPAAADQGSAGSPTLRHSRSGRLWQGQAFENLDTGVNALTCIPTACLKVRNMFDPQMETEDNWKVHMKDEILERCAGCDIVHMHIDDSLQGCVYIKCKDIDAAGQVYKRLHSCWFDGRLVTVKFLRLERYHERFPGSKSSSSPLKPGTHQNTSG